MLVANRGTRVDGVCAGVLLVGRRVKGDASRGRLMSLISDALSSGALTGALLLMAAKRRKRRKMGHTIRGEWTVHVPIRLFVWRFLRLFAAIDCCLRDRHLNLSNRKASRLIMS